MPYYTEPVTRAPNHRGKLRLTTVLGHLPGAVGHGFDGDGTPPRRGQEAGEKRIWFFEDALDELPDGVAAITPQKYTSIKAIRDATKPIPVEPEPRIDRLAVLEARIEALEGK